MFLTKIWTVLVTLFAVFVTAAFLVSTPPAETQLQEAYEQQLDGAHGLVDSHMKMESRRRLDFFDTVGKDYKIVKYLKELHGKNRKDGEAKAKELLAYLKQKLAKKGSVELQKRFTSMEFMDKDGKVWASLGENEGKFAFSRRSFPGVKRALERRVCSDNTLDLNGKLYFLWACPVRYVKEGHKVELVGAVFGRKVMDDDFALGLLRLVGETEVETGDKAKAKAKGKKKGKKKGKAKSAKGRKLKVNIAFFRRHKLVGKTSKSGLWKRVKDIYKKHKSTIDKASIGRSPAVEMKQGSKRYLMVVGRLPGQASKSGTVWVILWQFPTKLGPWAFWDSKLPKSALFKYLPMALFVILSILAVGLTIFLLIWEGDRPMGRLFKQSRALSAGEINRLDDTKFRGKLGSVCRSVNETLDRVADAAPTKPALHDKDLDAILGGPDVATDDFEPPPKEAVAGATSSVLDGVDTTPPGLPGQEVGGAPPPPPDLPPAAAGKTVPFGGAAGTPITTEPGTGPHGAPPPMPAQPPTTAQDEELAAFKEVFDQFVATKRQCGESVENLTLDAFAAKLRSNRQAVIEKTGCSDVNFRVYVKDGKAALKATPVK